jgi:hypothetical protein
MEPTNKAPAIDAMLSSIFGVDRTSTISEGKCVSCDSTGNIATSFCDDISRKEYAISGLCQSCQDDVFGGDDDEPEDPYSDAEADADTLASAGMGTDEDYGYSGDLDHF